MLVALVTVGAVFRLWGLGANRLNYDEAFTAMAGRLPVGSLFPFLRTHDSHPPLDYLLHLPLARLGVSAFWFRLPGVVCSVAALACEIPSGMRTKSPGSRSMTPRWVSRVRRPLA